MSQKNRKSIKELTYTEKIYWGKVSTGALTGALMGIIGIHNQIGWLTLFGVLFLSSYVFGKMFNGEDVPYSTKVKTAMFSYSLQVIFWWILLFNFFHLMERVPQ